MSIENFHCCATCNWFKGEKKQGKKVEYSCSRLGFETKPSYQFDCWNPKESVQRRLKELGIEFKYK